LKITEKEREKPTCIGVPDKGFNSIN
jgi:hypothetical protein